VQTNICENFDRKIMATKKLHICLLEIKKGEKERKEKNGARPATEPMWLCSPEPGAH